MAETPSSLIRRVRDPGDAESWREFVALYEPLLSSYVRSRGVRDQDAADLVQEVFTRLIKALPDFEVDHSRGRFRTWLWRVTMNTIADWARRERRQASAEEYRSAELAGQANARSQEEKAEAEWAAAHRRRVLQHVLARVRAESQPTTWACFEKHLLEGQPSAAVAAELGLTTNAVYVNASRVLARVRQQCADYTEELSDE